MRPHGAARKNDVQLTGVDESGRTDASPTYTRDKESGTTTDATPWLERGTPRVGCGQRADGRGGRLRL